jgi:chromosome segregation ATPase
MRRVILVLTALCGLSGAACGSGATILSREEYSRLPHEYRLEIFDAENDVVIARNREEEALDHKAEAEKTLAELEDGWKKTSARLSASGQAAKVSKARHVLDTDVAYVEAQIDVASAAIRRAEAETSVRRARLELVRQRQAARVGRATVGSIKGFEDRVASLENKLKAATAAEVELRTKVQGKLNAWKVAEDEYAASTNDYDTGVWE